MKTAAILLTLLFLPAFTFSATIKVPVDYPTIQEGIDAAADGDTVLVAAGTYVENIDFKGKAITVTSESGPDVTIIDGNQAGSVITIIGSGSGTVVDGFTITNGSGTVEGTFYAYGGGIYCIGPSATIMNNVITGNTATGPNASGSGGGIFCGIHSSPMILGNVISNNTVEKGFLPSNGGGICCSSKAIIANNIITDNKAPDAGGGIYGVPNLYNNVIAGNEASVGGGIFHSEDSGFIENNTIVKNKADKGGGVFSSVFVDMTCILNSILWDNEAAEGPEIYLQEEIISYAFLTISYSDVDGGLSSVYVGTGSILNWGAGMIDSDPLFFDRVAGDYHLQQDPCQPVIVNPCVDTGSTLVTYNGYYSCSTKTNNDKDEGVVDMGFHYGSYTDLNLSLTADTCFLSQGAGGTVIFKLSAGEENSGRNYLILGGTSGTDPGTLLPGGLATIPINWDWFTDLELSLLGNSPVFTDFLGKLDDSGKASAQLIAPALPPVALGVVMHYAYCCNSPFDYVSNPVEVEVVH
jgi:hypothetical protein